MGKAVRKRSSKKHGLPPGMTPVEAMHRYGPPHLLAELARLTEEARREGIAAVSFATPDQSPLRAVGSVSGGT